MIERHIGVPAPFVVAIVASPPQTTLMHIGGMMTRHTAHIKAFIVSLIPLMAIVALRRFVLGHKPEFRVTIMIEGNRFPRRIVMTIGTFRTIPSVMHVVHLMTIDAFSGGNFRKQKIFVAILARRFAMAVL